MKFEIVTNGAKSIERSDNIGTWAEQNGVKVIAHEFGAHLNQNLRGMPKLEGFHGPSGGGDDPVRYEDWESFKILSD